MSIIIKKLTPELCDDFLYYFDKVAFSDHEDWSFCYCLECHLDKETQEKTAGDKPLRRKMAENLVNKEVMQGYLAYDGEHIVGWCNAADKISYRHLQEDEEFVTDDCEEGEIKAVYCYDIAPSYRGTGIASKMLEKVCRDSEEEGYMYVEAYPFLDTDFAYPYHGTIGMYKRNGFVCYAERK